jgi:hypothetical protein
MRRGCERGLDGWRDGSIWMVHHDLLSGVVL